MKSGVNKVKKFILSLMAFLIFSECSLVASDSKPKPAIDSKGNSVKVSFTNWHPFSYIKDDHAAGFDMLYIKKILLSMNMEAEFIHSNAGQQFFDIHDGKLDVITGVTASSDRAQYSYFSIPYREESNALFTLTCTKKKISTSSIPEFMSQVKAKKYRLGVLRGYVYADKRLNDFIRDPKNAERIFVCESDEGCIHKLLEGEIDGYITDRVVGAFYALQMHVNHKIMSFPFDVTTPISFAFSKKSTSPEFVAQVNEKIKKMQKERADVQLSKRYIMPVLLSQIIGNPSFLLIDLIGTIAFAISGLMVAFRERSGLFGTFFMATIPAVGGGVIRDLLVAREPIAILNSPIYLISIFITVILGYLIVKISPAIIRYFNGSSSRDKGLKILNYLFVIFDSLGLATFTVVGAVVAMVMQAEPLWLWAPLLAVITSAGGGIIRDLFRSDNVIAVFTGELYAEIAVFWGIVLTMFLFCNRDNANFETLTNSLILVIIGGFISRMFVHHFKIKSPLFTLHDSTLNGNS